jgi:hypothetical protein
MLQAHQKFVSDPTATRKDSSKSILNGIVQTSLDPFQREALDGVIRSAMPESKQSNKEGQKMNQGLSSVKASKTRNDPGKLHYPGSSYA